MATTSKQFYSCLIVYYSDHDRVFAERLHKDLLAVGVTITTTVSVPPPDCSLVVCSEQSLHQPHISQAIELALDRITLDDIKALHLLLLPIDAYLFTSWPHPMKLEIISTLTIPFRGWDVNSGMYELAFERLITMLIKHTSQGTDIITDRELRGDSWVQSWIEDEGISPENLPGYVVREIFYATDRQIGSFRDPPVYENERSSAHQLLSFGRCLVTIPSTHNIGSLESPGIWKGQFLGDPRKHVVLSRLSWKWRKRSAVKIAERTREKTTEALHGRRKSRHSEAASFGERGGIGPVRGTGSAADGLLSLAEGVL